MCVCVWRVCVCGVCVAWRGMAWRSVAWGKVVWGATGVALMAGPRGRAVGLAALSVNNISTAVQAVQSLYHTDYREAVQYLRRYVQ